MLPCRQIFRHRLPFARALSSPSACYKMEVAGATSGMRDPATVTSRLLDDNAVAEYHTRGYVVAKGLFDKDEAQALRERASEAGVMDKAYGKEDASGKMSKLSLFNTPGINIFGAVARSARVVDNVELLLGGWSHGEVMAEEAYHYHSKIMIKDPEVGGAWEWHQDYGYWYSNGCLLPKMLSCMVALNDHTLENGCLRVLQRSHHLGRVTHKLTGDQAGADPMRLPHILSKYSDEPVKLEAGDALFFHSNLFHASAANTSKGPRLSLIVCFNTRSNNPLVEHHHPCYTPHDRWPDTAVRDLQDLGIEYGDGTVFMDPDTDKSAKGEDQ
eukprot:gnl/MRDRNA2_/MRDRNA2_101760_c0_seq1.p1 gnl/MRDRNA2_/MRDRNA2_101760_c0~~gnl/MRDRNA2_/MRDRNA2_101760_c0_seq1.p1  ORF type:complete len:328 (-),score=53.05 gnl/MRDRNA2_/MRDRNA2_101760_c0_seq1:167-1150(-)